MKTTDDTSQALASRDHIGEDARLHLRAPLKACVMAGKASSLLLGLAVVAALTAGCAQDRVVTKVETVEVKVPVPVPCSMPRIEAPEPPDLAPADLDDWEVSQWIRVRLIDLRAALDAYVAHVSSCAGAGVEAH